MPRFDNLNTDDMQATNLAGSNYGYSATALQNLGSSEYTLVQIVVDRSGSTQGFQDEMERVVKEIVASQRRSPRADSMLVRFVRFDSRMDEMHGFKPLANCNPDDYIGTLPSGGTTALFDTVENCLLAGVDYASKLSEQDYLVNQILVVITDGCDYGSRKTVNAVAAAKQAADAAVRAEKLESNMMLLIGINVQSPQVSVALTDLKDQGGFDQYVEAATADKATLARVCGYVSQSISSASQSLGTGGPSQAITQGSITF